MKILVVSNLFPPDFVGGYEVGCRQAVAGLRRRGHEVRVLTSAPRLPVPRANGIFREFRLTDLSNPFCMARCPADVVDAHEIASHLIDAGNVHVLARAVEEFRPDVCYVWNLIGLGGLGLMACLLQLRVPWVWHFMDAVPLTLCSRRRQFVPPLARLFERLLAGEYLACSRRLVAEIETGGIHLPGRVEIVPNWISGQRPPPRSRYYRGGSLRIVSAGQIGRHKGVDIIIEAAGQLRRAGYENFSVDVYGKLTDPCFPERIAALNLSDHVTLQGPRQPEALQALYRQHDHDVFAFPTWEREPFAFAPMEAAAHGCVPILSERCGNADWFIHGFDCLKIRRTPEALAACLSDILTGKVALEPIGRRAESVLWRDFHLDNMLPRIEAALQRTARQPRRAGRPAREIYQIALLAEKFAAVAGKQPCAA